MAILIETLREIWLVTCEMSPYLLLGFLVAGVLSVVVSAATVERHLGQPGLWQVIKASLLGVPLPLCSCSVVPVSASLYQHGATKGATLSFLASTPQTGIDSIAVTWGLLGPLISGFRIVVAFVSGILAGGAVEFGAGARQAALERARKRAEEPAACGCCTNSQPGSSRFRRGFRYGFITLPRDMGRAMFVGLLISGLLTALIPENYFADRLGPGIVSMLLMMLIGIPIYTCSSGSVPVALALVHAGVSPGAALVFLITGPATNAATVATIAQVLGRRAVITYLLAICATALVAGLLLDQLAGPDLLPVHPAHAHGGVAGAGGLKAILAVILLVVLGQAFVPRRKAS